MLAAATAAAADPVDKDDPMTQEDNFALRAVFAPLELRAARPRARRAGSGSVSEV